MERKTNLLERNLYVYDISCVGEGLRINIILACDTCNVRGDSTN